MDFLDYVKNIKSTFNNIEKKLSKYNKKLSFLRRKKGFLDFIYKNYYIQTFTTFSFISAVYFLAAHYSLELDNNYKGFFYAFIFFLIPLLIFSTAVTSKLIDFFIKDNLYYKLDENEKEFIDFFSCIDNKNNFNNEKILYYYFKNNDDKTVLSNLKNLINFIKNNDIDRFSIFYIFIFHSLKNCYELNFISNDEFINNVNYCIEELNITYKNQVLKIKNDINDITFSKNKNLIINDKSFYTKEKNITF